VTLSCMTKTQKGMVETMTWLRKMASTSVKGTGESLQWTMPLGLPVMQPYLKAKKRNVTGAVAVMTVDGALDDVDASPNTTKQTSAFPPNFVHALDSSHMMMTANACADAGIEFTAVHDSYWTHACDIDAMSAILRDQFVKLHEQPLLVRLKEELQDLHPDLDLSQTPKAPENGDLDLSDVKRSPYFFS
jgi:DNA-directed RNA polymerase